MDLVDAVVSAKKVARQAVNNSAVENRNMIGGALQGAAHKSAKVMEKNVVGATVLDTGKFVGKAVKKSQLGGAVLDGAGLVGNTALGLVTDGAGLVGGTVLEGANLIGKTAMMGGELLGEGINILIGEDDGSAFFHEEVEELEGYDNDFEGDALMPERFHSPAKKERQVRDSMMVKWDERSWSEFDGGLEGHNVEVVVEKTASQRKLEIEEAEAKGEQTVAKEDWESDSEESVESDKTDDIYFTDAEIKAKKKAEKRERKRLRKEKKRMSKAEKAEAKKREEEALKKEEEQFKAFGKSFSGLRQSINMATSGGPTLNAVAEETSQDPTGEALPGPPVDTLAMMGRQTSEGMDDVQKKQRTKNLWGKLKQDVTKRAVVKTFQSNVKQKVEFFSVFDEKDALDGMKDPLEAATTMLENEHDSEKDKVQKLRKQLDDYEANLEKERKEVEEERKRIATEKEELQSQFSFETERNAELTSQFHDLKEQLDVELEKRNEVRVQRELEELRAENEVLHEQVENADNVLRQLHRDKAIREKREKRTQLYGADDRTTRSSVGTIQTFRSTGTNTVMMFDDEATVVTYVAKSRRSSNTKVMGENLEEMNDELEARQKVIEMQVTELENLNKQLKEAEDRSGVKPLRDEYLQVKKQTEELNERTKQEKEALELILEAKKDMAAKYAAEISRLKLEQTKKELKAAQEAEPPKEKGGLFGMLWGDAPEEEHTDADVALAKLGL